MRATKPFTAALAVVATAIALGIAAPAAQAQTFTRVCEMESIGGYTAYQAKIIVWYYDLSGQGFVLCERRYHSGETLQMTGQISNQAVMDLWWKAYYAAPWTNADTKNTFLNVDLPDTKFTYMTNWAQMIHAQPSSSNLPQVTTAMKTCIDALWDLAQQISERDLFKYQGSGGLAGLDESIVIKRDGAITQDRSFGRGSGQVTHKQGHLSPAEVNELKTLCSPWWSFPNAFNWPAGTVVYDGIDYSGWYNYWGYSRTVSSKTAAQEDSRYSAILQKVGDFANAIP